ncbi:MAG: polynucleotide adenylyltransferase PcnB [Vicinamibacteria bacterium]|nr:polynucleotide adenylyltransferase PcnB [Vicinamibacteria bacterium]
MNPHILPRAEHTLSRKNIDNDALKVLYRLKNRGFVAYLVGGGVRDLLLGRTPKDFDIATSAHPQQVKRLFRNSVVIGRRFRLCHIRFGNKVVEVSTFRRQAEAEGKDRLIRRDNTFGNPEEDAFRRDFTVNALFYDIATFSIIDFVRGLPDLKDRVIRTIGDPAVRFEEDPVRMLRAVALAERLSFTIDRDTVEAIRHLRGEIMKSSPARLLEELYKIMRQGAARSTFLRLHQVGLLAYIFPEADDALRAGDMSLLDSLGRLDGYRNSGKPPEELTNPILMGTVLVPLNLPLRRHHVTRDRSPEVEPGETAAAPPPTDDVPVELAILEAIERNDGRPVDTTPLTLPFAKRDFDRLRLIAAAQRRLAETRRPLHAQKTLLGRGYFVEALRWNTIHGGDRGGEITAYWRGFADGDHDEAALAERTPSRPRRGRRRGRRGRRRSLGAPSARAAAMPLTGKA